MTKKERRAARRNINKVYSMLTSSEKRLLRRARAVSNLKIRKGQSSRPGIKQWAIENNAKRLDEMKKLGLIK